MLFNFLFVYFSIFKILYFSIEVIAFHSVHLLQSCILLLLFSYSFFLKLLFLETADGSVESNIPIYNCECVCLCVQLPASAISTAPGGVPTLALPSQHLGLGVPTLPQQQSQSHFLQGPGISLLDAGRIKERGPGGRDSQVHPVHQVSVR